MAAGRSALKSYKKGDGWWNSKISEIKKNEIKIRGYQMQDLMGNVTFSQMFYLLLCGEILEEKKAKLFDAVLVAGADHGVRAPSIAVARMAATCGISFNSAVATGINVLGDNHGGATEKGMRIYYETWEEAGHNKENLPQIVDKKLDEILARKENFPGMGHQLHDNDPRVPRLYELAQPLIDERDISGVYLHIAELYRKTLSEKKNRHLTMNVDGVSAAVQCELGLPAEAGKGIYAISRGMGITAHAYEELMTGVMNKGPCPNDEELVKYSGIDHRTL